MSVAATAAPQVLLLPGWHNSGPDHWQSRWEALYGYTRVEQHDWDLPRRGDWLARLDDVVQSTSGPLVLVAHSLGCVLVAAWAKYSQHRQRVTGALLVAPADVEQEHLRSVLPSWAPIVREPLPFASRVVASRNDPFGPWPRIQALAQGWGSELVDVGACGHINAESGLGNWPAGHALLAPWLRPVASA